MGRPSQGTREKLIETARELIWRESYNAVSVDEICKKADVKKGSFYHYFPSKADLAVEAMDAGMQEMKEYYDDIFSPTRPATERFSLMARHVVEHQREIATEYGHVCGCPFAGLGSEVAGQNEIISEKITDICVKKSAYYTSALRALIAEGLVDPMMDVEAKANEIFAFIVGQLVMAKIWNDLDFLEKNLERGVFDLIGLRMPVGKAV